MWWVILIGLSPMLFIVGIFVYAEFTDFIFGRNKKLRERVEWLMEVLASLKCPRCDHSLSEQGFQLHNSDDFKPNTDNFLDFLTIECPNCGLESTFKFNGVGKSLEVVPESK